MEARARSTDPETSHEAARSVTSLTRKQAHVLRVLREIGPLTDVALCEAYRTHVMRGLVERQSESGIRTRRHELAEMDPPRVVRVGTTTLQSGRRAIRWKAAEG